MSTRASIIFKQDGETMYFYRHSDGYPDGAGADLKEFVATYYKPDNLGGVGAGSKAPGMRRNIGQSAGWLVVRGHFEYRSAEPADYPNPQPDSTGPQPNGKYYSGMDWKVGAYEPTMGLHGDVEYIYIIDLDKGTLSCREPKRGFWDDPTLENTVACRKFKTVRF